MVEYVAQFTPKSKIDELTMTRTLGEACNTCEMIPFGPYSLAGQSYRVTTENPIPEKHLRVLFPRLGIKIDEVSKQEEAVS